MKSHIGLAHGICGVTNPFCKEATGARWPDNSNSKSLTFDVEGAYIEYATDAAGTAGSLYTAAPANMRYACSISGTTATSLTSSSFVGFPTMARWRCTSWGLKLSCSLPPLSTQGTVSIRLFSPEKLSTLASYSITAPYADAVYDVPLRRLIDHDMFVIPMPLGDRPRIFNPTDTVTVIGSGDSYGWQVASVAVIGAPVSTAGVLRITAYYHYEFVPPDGDQLYTYAKAPPKQNKLITDGNGDVLSSVGNFIEGTASKVDAVVNSKAAKYIGAIGGFFLGGPAGSAAGYAMLKDVD